VVAFFGVIKSSVCSYTRTRFLIPRSCAYLDSLGKFSFRAKLRFKNKCRARAGFGLVISSSGQVRASQMKPIYNFAIRYCLFKIVTLQKTRPNKDAIHK